MKSIGDTNKKNLLTLILLFMSNFVTYQLASLPQEMNTPQESYMRPDYDTIKLIARSYIPFERLRPIHVKDDGRLIAYCLLIDKNPETEEFTLYCPKKFLGRLVNSQNPHLIPYQEDLKITTNNITKGRSYEISIP
ncbi:MAG: hypothetical protein CME65_01135 [Halobacteriovoraceae bacterium]|nr:hypothetical protein [Halobacteriovoraceae bacterium]